MGFELTRIKKKKEKQKKRSRRFMVTMTLLTIIGLIGAGTLVYQIVEQYNKTNEWKKNEIEGDLANITPEFAKNHVSAELLDDVNDLSVIPELLKQIDKDKGVTDQSVDKTVSTYKKGQAILKKHKITSGDIHDQLELLKLYVDIHQLEKNSYQEFNTEELSRIMTILSGRLITNPKDSDKVIMDRLNTIANDYNTLNTFVDTYLPQIGKIENGILTVLPSVNQELTDEILTTIEEQGLSKFDKIKTLKTLLQSDKWKKAVSDNDATNQKNAWSQVVSEFNQLTKSNYIKYSDIATYKDALSYGLAVTGFENRNGYELLETSVVSTITVNGVEVKPGQYFKRDSDVVVTITPNYKVVTTESTTTVSTTVETTVTTEPTTKFSTEETTRVN